MSLSLPFRIIRHGFVVGAVALLLTACSLPDIPLLAPAPPPEPEVVDPPCVDIPRSSSLLGYLSRLENDAVWYSGCFNPANADEAAVVGVLPGLTGGAYGLYRLNLRTRQYQLLFDGVADKTVAWSLTGWIVFQRGGELWKVKPHGDSARQFTNANRILYGVETLNPDGSQVLPAAFPATSSGAWACRPTGSACWWPASTRPCRPPRPICCSSATAWKP